MKVSVEDGGKRVCLLALAHLSCTPEQPETSLNAGSLAFMIIYMQYITCLYM